MARKFYAPADYVYPWPNDHALRNLYNGVGTDNLDILRDFERSAVRLRHRELLADPSLITKTYDAEHLCALHRHLFQDVYEWAGGPTSRQEPLPDPHQPGRIHHAFRSGPSTAAESGAGR